MAIKTKLPSKKKLLKIPSEDYDKIEALADKYTGGNVSMWFKYAALNHVPSPDDLSEEEE